MRKTTKMKPSQCDGKYAVAAMRKAHSLSYWMPIAEMLPKDASVINVDAIRKLLSKLSK